MMSKEFLKSLGILVVSMGLTASPLVLANTHDGDPGSSDPAIDPTDRIESDERDPVPDESLQEPRTDTESGTSTGTGSAAGTGSGTEMESDDPGSSDPAIDPTDRIESDERDPVPDESLQEPREDE
ncbi:hypothetical protein [Halomonas korlensis]|uniref:Uncharacterized protein n=1 Tax=Halomonas korlensis TaxID=463301 RepID=A0A1I7HYW6_9GAMM|nr:hypothetical protein [Halomonas korlensis]SFU65879.1 hypothetical protein SAMN04487955_105202 [Halomonas korlensis]